MSRSHLSSEPLDLLGLLGETAGVDAGAVVIFLGDVRGMDQGQAVAALDYDVHPALAESALARIEEEACRRDGVLACRIVHRTGLVGAGETSVISIVRARHRAQAFDAARETIERLKREVAIWKEDVAPDGSRRVSDPGMVLEADAGSPSSALPGEGSERAPE